MKLVILDYGAGNVKSVQFACKRLGFDAVISNNAEVLKRADKVIFPGVGEASSAMKKLKGKQLDHVIKNLEQPVLGICLGMQLMCQYTEEGTTQGLGIFDVSVKKFAPTVKVPHIGWNTISGLKTSLFKGVSEASYVYLVHSFYAEKSNETTALTTYGVDYSSALQKANFFGVQFHPEKSGDVGELILNNFLTL